MLVDNWHKVPKEARVRAEGGLDVPIRCDCACNRCGREWSVTYEDDDWDRRVDGIAEDVVWSEVTRCPGCGALDIKARAHELREGPA